MKECKKCGMQNLGDARFCEKCGEAMNSRKGISIAFVALLAILLIGGAVFVLKYLTGNGTDTDVEEDGIVRVVKNACSEGDEEEDVSLQLTSRQNVLQTIKAANVLRIAVEANAPPMNIVKENDDATIHTGFEYDLIKLIAKEMGINEIEIVHGDYNILPTLISNEKNIADIFMGGYIADPDILNVSWSDPYFENGFCLIVPAGSAIKTIKDLTGKRIGIYKDDAARKFVEENVANPASILLFEESYNSNCEEEESGTWMCEHLLGAWNGKRIDPNNVVDAIIYDYIFAKEEIKISNERLKIVQFNLNTIEYQIGMPKNDFNLLREINLALNKVIKTEVYVDLIRKYLDVDPGSVSLPELDANTKIHIVAAGETLGKIAEKYNIQRWVDLWEANKTRIPNPNLIHIGDQIIIP